MNLFNSLKARIFVSIIIVILYFGIVLDFSFSKIFIHHVDEPTIFSSDFKRILFYFGILICSFLFLKKKYRLIILPLYIIWAIQFLNFSNTGVFLSPLTIENLSEFSSIGLNLLIKFIFLFVLSLALFCYLLFIIPKLTFSYTWKFILLTILSFSFLLIFTIRSSYPVARFAESFYIVYLNNYAKIERNDGKQFIGKFVNSFYSNNKINPVNPKNERLNLIIIFTEGLSDRVISKTLTPNLYKLKQNSIYFENYYNHTAPTFRGLRGQLISGFVRAANSDVNNMSQSRLEQTFQNTCESLPSIFNNYSYDTVFIGPHPSNSKLYSYMKVTGFTNIRSSEDYKDNNKHYPDLSDQDIFKLLSETIDKEKDSCRNFFISIYNVETHHGVLVKDNLYGKGDNDFFNKFYNYDYWLGNFINWFNNSEVSDNTVLVITSDHSSYAVPLFEDTFKFKSNTKTKFVDNIPFIVYRKGITHHIYNAHGRNSLCLAPTILDLIGFGVSEQIQNHFLGTSLFVDNESEFEHISIIGASSVRTNENDYCDIELGSDIQKELDTFFGFSG